MYIVEDDIDMCGQSLIKRNEKRKRDSGGSCDSFSFFTFQEGGPSKKRCTLDSNNSNHPSWSNSEVLQNSFHNNMYPTWPSTTVPSYVSYPINSLGTTNILNTNIMGTNIMGTNTLNTNIMGTNTLNTNIMGTNILNTNTLGTFGNNTMGTNTLNTNTLGTFGNNTMGTNILNTNTLGTFGNNTMGTNTLNTNTLNTNTLGTFGNNHTLGTNTLNTNIMGTNTLNTNSLGTFGNNTMGNINLGNHTLGTNILGTNILGTNMLGANTLGTNMLGTNTLRANMLGANTLGPNTLGTPSLEVQTKSNGWNNELGLCVTIRTLSGKAVEIRIKPTDRVKDIKETIYCNEGIPPEQQRLVFKGHVMADEKYVSDYGMLSGSLIHMVLALRGGCQTSILNSLGGQTGFLKDGLVNMSDSTV